jgi:uncharacterized protein
MVTLLSARDKTRIRRLTERIERETGVEIAVLVVRQADDAAALARSYFDHVGIGKAGRHDGVLVLVALDNRRIHVELGRGLAGTVQSADAQRVIDHVIAPQFRRGRFGDGLAHGVEALAHLVQSAAAAR